MYFTYHMCLKLGELTYVKYFGFFSTTTYHTLTTQEYIFGVFNRAGARERSVFISFVHLIYPVSAT